MRHQGMIQIAAPSVQVTSSGTSQLQTVPNDASGNVAKAIRISAKAGAYVLPHLAKFAEGTIVLTGQPVAAETVTVNGTAVTWNTDVTIGATFQATAKALWVFLRDSANANIDDARYYYDETNAPGTIRVVHRVAGTAGNSFTLAEASTNLTVSGATLAGGAQTAATAGNSMYVASLNPVDLWMHPLNAVSILQETGASIVNISPIETA